MTAPVYITGMACLSGYGLTLDALCHKLADYPACAEVVPAARRAEAVACALVPDFKESLAPYAKPMLRRKMSRLSKMAVTAVGDALAAAALSGQDNSRCGVVLGTAFGSTAQSALFYGDFLDKGAMKVNPGYFPETVPNAPAGQISIIFGLQGPNTTVCQQALSSEHALALAHDLLVTGMAHRLVVVGVEEMSPALLAGLQACGQLQKWSAAAGQEIRLERRLRVGEASVALVLESLESLESRRGKALARLHGVVTAGAAAWPAVYHEVGSAVSGALRGLGSEACRRVQAVVAGSSFVGRADRQHVAALADHLGGQLPTILPEYGTGTLMGAGLLRTALAVRLVNGGQLACRALDRYLPERFLYSDLYDHQVGRLDYALASTVTPGGGAGAVLVGGL
mgnify:CR=1 FL=1